MFGRYKRKERVEDDRTDDRGRGGPRPGGRDDFRDRRRDRSPDRRGRLVMMCTVFAFITGHCLCRPVHVNSPCCASDLLNSCSALNCQCGVRFLFAAHEIVSCAA